MEQVEISDFESKIDIWKDILKQDKQFIEDYENEETEGDDDFIDTPFLKYIELEIALLEEIIKTGTVDVNRIGEITVELFGFNDNIIGYTDDTE